MRRDGGRHKHCPTHRCMLRSSHDFQRELSPSITEIEQPVGHLPAKTFAERLYFIVRLEAYAVLGVEVRSKAESAVRASRWSHTCFHATHIDFSTNTLAHALRLQFTSIDSSSIVVHHLARLLAQSLFELILGKA